MIFEAEDTMTIILKIVYFISTLSLAFSFMALEINNEKLKKFHSLIFCIPFVAAGISILFSIIALGIDVFKYYI